MKVQHSGDRFRGLVIGASLIVVILLAALGVTSAEILSAARPCAGDGMLWSKGQRDAVHHLANYMESHRAVDYQRFVGAIAVPLGDQKARTELERPNPDLAIARQRFMEGGKDASDIDAIAWLSRHFRRVPWMPEATTIQADADLQVAALNELAHQVHERILQGETNTPGLHALLERLPPLNDRLTGLEQRFSASMGETSRMVRRLVEFATLSLALALVTAILFSAELRRRKSRAEHELRASGERIRLLWETAPDAIIMFDGCMQNQYANAVVKDLFGHEPGAIIGRDVAMLQPERLRNAHRRAMALYLRTGRKTLNWRNIEMTGLHRNGCEIPLEIALSHRENNGEHQFACFIRDLSVRNQSAQSLRASEDRLRRALEASGLCLWDFDVKADSVYLSESWSQLLGGPPQVTRTTFTALADLVPESERSGLHQALVTALKDPQACYRVEHRVRRSNGEWLWNLSEGRVVERGADGCALRMVGTNRDITPLKHAEATRRGLEVQLRESQKMEAIGTLAAGIAHDFNNVLGAILGNLGRAREDMCAGHAAQHSLEQINKSALRARTLVQQILAFSRRQPQELLRRPLRPVVQETLELLRSSLPAAVSLEARLTDAPLHVLADATQVEQVLMNLCTNGWHALQGQAGRVVVGMEPTELRADCSQRPGGLPPGGYAHLWVSDSGSGMDPATRARIFEPFFTTKPVGQGTGLGLSVVHGIVAAHSGAITVDSAPGQGSTFHMYLPLCDLQSPAAPFGRGTPQRQSVQRQGQGEHVLYVDDDEVMVLLAERLLRRLGYRVTCYQCPLQAVAAVRARSQTFDLVVSDFNMPELSGLEVAREVARIRADLPVVISSGHITEEQRAEILRAGVHELLQKENTFEELGAIVHRLLRRRVGVRQKCDALQPWSEVELLPRDPVKSDGPLDWHAPAA